MSDSKTEIIKQVTRGKLASKTAVLIDGGMSAINVVSTLVNGYDARETLRCKTAQRLLAGADRRKDCGLILEAIPMTEAEGQLILCQGLVDNLKRAL